MSSSDTHKESINNDELQIEPFYEYVNANIQELVSNCYDNFINDELASKGDELEEEHIFELLL
jgi:effector-binding domain-containing protein